MSQAAAHLYYDAGNLEKAREAFRKSAAAEQRNAPIHYSLALLEAEMQNPAEALRLLHLTMEIDPLLGRALYNLGLAESTAGNISAACADLRQPAKLLSQDPATSYALATILLRTGDRAGELAAARRALTIDPEMPEAQQLVKTLSTPQVR
jgi:tetratricopeptide (TPR) repeat protein